MSSAISERIIPQMQGVVETTLNRQLESVPRLSRRPQDTENNGGNVDENNLQNRNSCSRQNLLEPEDESPYNKQIYMHQQIQEIHNKKEFFRAPEPHSQKCLF